MTVQPGEDVVRIARGWIGTPYHHQASRRGIGADCLGLVRGVWREICGHEPVIPLAYSRDWAEAAGRETMLEAAALHLRTVARAEMAAGHVLLFRLRPGFAAKHAGILSGPATMIHAMEGTGVTEIALSPWWKRRIAGVFAFPASEI